MSTRTPSAATAIEVETETGERELPLGELAGTEAVAPIRVSVACASVRGNTAPEADQESAPVSDDGMVTVRLRPHEVASLAISPG